MAYTDKITWIAGMFGSGAKLLAVDHAVSIHRQINFKNVSADGIGYNYLFDFGTFRIVNVVLEISGYGTIYGGTELIQVPTKYAPSDRDEDYPVVVNQSGCSKNPDQYTIKSDGKIAIGGSSYGDGYTIRILYMLYLQPYNNKWYLV